ncbi:hypothetical protein [Thiohalocapsa halophila]
MCADVRSPWSESPDRTTGLSLPLLLLLLPALYAFASPASAGMGAHPEPSRVDPRLRQASYHPDQVYVLHAQIGRAL